jgi:hypothetical protein
LLDAKKGQALAPAGTPFALLARGPGVTHPRAWRFCLCGRAHDDRPWLVLVRQREHCRYVACLRDPAAILRSQWMPSL